MSLPDSDDTQTQDRTTLKTACTSQETITLNNGLNRADKKGHKRIPLGLMINTASR